jgi:hypothetical protein
VQKRQATSGNLNEKIRKKCRENRNSVVMSKKNLRSTKKVLYKFLVSVISRRLLKFLKDTKLIRNDQRGHHCAKKTSNVWQPTNEKIRKKNVVQKMGSLRSCPKTYWSLLNSYSRIASEYRTLK